jgi:tRNA threonylcarbamoyladenosine biosynthesis protein TsaB
MSLSLDLILDTSRHGIALGVYAGENPVCETYEPDCRGENLGRLLDSALASAHIALSDITRVLVTLGPGSFTGLRTGIAFCQGLCFSGNRKLYGVSTLEALRTLSTHSNAAVLLRARPGYWYLGLPSGEFFLSSEETTDCLVKNIPQVLVCDAAAAADFLNFAHHHHASIVEAQDSEIKPFNVFFNRIAPSLTQKANYIQPSYFEKAK